MAQGIRDRFANVASISVVQPTINSLVFASLATNMGFLGRRDQALAMIIDEIQFLPEIAAVVEANADGDEIRMSITDSDQVTDLSDLTDRRILDSAIIVSKVIGTATSHVIYDLPLRKQFFPPLITAARTLFLGLNTTGLATVATCRARILYRVETLTGAELVELSEVFRLTG